ncbi:aminotransferase class IV family protein [Shinella yambaruensis]|uniref:aminotransferase class IV family protein n=1 Tax=Shinella yambaruensis TaxID=415996 RepID=UPI003D7B8087
MDISLIETLRWEPAAGFVRLERHLARLARSAAALGLAGSEGAEQALFAALPPSALPRGEIGRGADPCSDAALAVGETPLHPISPLAGEMPGRAEGGSPQGTPLRIRLELFPDGRIDIQMAPFTPLAPDARWRLKIAGTRLSSADPMLRHKTSRRSVYTTARAEVPATEAEEVILLNERGELCEGTITSLFLDDGTGILKTPPLASGLLAGVLREELLGTGKAVEEILRPKDLAEGTAFVGNSLRGLIRGELT